MPLIEGETCERCAIAWERLFESSPGEYVQLREFTETPRELQDAFCPSCQVIGAFLITFKEVLVTMRWNPGWPCLEFENLSSATCIEAREDLGIYRQDDEEFLDLCLGSPRGVDFEQAKRCIQNCLVTHDKCNPPPKSLLKGLHVLDCQSRTVILAPEHCKYVALSYVWGQTGLGENMDFPTLPSILPRTVQDSIEATKMLGCRYLWIDRYCIDQSDSVAQHQQIGQMGDIYSCAHVTLIAAAGQDANYGIPGVTNHFEAPKCCALPHGFRLACTDRIGDRSISGSSWFSRAWTFQEGYLSKRRMYFTDYGVTYICDNEIRQSYRAYIGASLPISYEPLHSMLQRLMEEYTRRNLTHDSDALNAIIGALETFQEIDHVWGVALWREIHVEDCCYQDVCIAVHWRHLSSCSRRKELPSWSPLGWRGEIDYFSRPMSVSPACLLEVWHNGEFKKLSEAFGKLSVQHRTFAPEKSKFLRLTTTVVLLEFMYLDGSEVNNNGIFAKVPYSEELDVFVEPFWDIEHSHKSCFMNGNMQLPCAVVARYPIEFEQEGHLRFEEELQILILRSHDTYYERIGCIRMDLDCHAFARDKKGRQWKLKPRISGNPGRAYVGNLRKYGDGTYWMSNGEERTFILG